MILDLSLKSKSLWDGCTVRQSKGKLCLRTPMTEAVPILKKNLEKFILALGPSSRDYYPICITGAMMPWVYIVATLVILKHGWTVSYSDGSEAVKIGRL